MQGPASLNILTQPASNNIMKNSVANDRYATSGVLITRGLQPLKRLQALYESRFIAALMGTRPVERALEFEE